MSELNSEGRRCTHDAIVVGGGPAGSTTATLLAQQGHRVLLVDREQFPRFRIGESLMPATYWTLERLGVLEKLARTPFPRKYSVQFYSSSGRAARPFYFSEVNEHTSSITWQVDRSEFDRLLLDHAAASGVEVRQQVNVQDVLFDGERAVGVVATDRDGRQRELGARVVVDATGQTGLLSRRLKLRRVDPQLRHAALYTRYRGVPRDAGIDEGATVIYWTADERSWFWFIPLPDDLVSVGVVGRVDHLFRGRPAAPQAVYDEELSRCPALAGRLAHGRIEGAVQAIRDFSYISTRIAGDGWVLVGDAFGFLDPIYSTGVFLALKSAEFAADSIHAAFEKDDLSGASLGAHGERYLAGLEALRKLVYAYYDRKFSFAKLLQRNPECRVPLVHLLMGNVFREPVDGLFDAMGRMVELPEARRLGSLEAGA